MKGLLTGTAMIVSSLYGGTQALQTTTPTITVNNSIAPVTASSTAISEASSTPKTAFSDNTGVQNFIKKSYSDEPVLIAIAGCESAYRQYDPKTGAPLLGKENPSDIGVMQINQKYHLEKAAELGFDIRTVEGNVAYGRYLYDNQGAEPWSASKPCWSRVLSKAGGNPDTIAALALN